MNSTFLIALPAISFSILLAACRKDKEVTGKISQDTNESGLAVSDPKMGVENPIFTVSGGVAQPGQHALRKGMTLLGALSRVGGFDGKVKKVKILRGGNVIVVDLRRINPDGSNNPVLMDGDEVIVPAG